MDNFYRLSKILGLTIVLSLGLSFITISSFAQQNGKLSGKVTDKATGETLVGLSILIEGTSIGASTDAEGKYVLNTIKPGTYSVIFSYVSYKKKILTGIVVSAGQTKNLDVEMEADAAMLNSVVIAGKRATGSEVAVLQELKKSQSIANGVSSQTIQKSGDSDAAQVVKRVPGITIVDNRFINIRGLAERYNTVQLNNVIAPSLETDVRSFSFDLIPSNQIDRMLVFKSPSADLPGDFAGGVVKVFLKSIPDDDRLTIDYGTNYRQNASFEQFSRPTSGDLYFTGFNSGDNDLPVNFPKNLRTVSSGMRNAAGHSLGNNWAPVTTTANLDQKLNIYGSKRFNINNKLLGNITAISYSNSKTNNDVFRGDYNTFDVNTNTPSAIYNYNDRQYNYNVRLGIIHNWAIKFNDNHTFEFKNLYNQLGTSQYINRTGENFESDYLPNSYSSSMLYRGVYSGQLAGTHKFNNGITKVDWVAGYGRSFRDQPDYKRYRSDIDETTGKSVLFVPTGAAQAEFLGRFYSRMDETVKTYSLNLEEALDSKSEIFKPAVKFGVYYEEKDREFTSRNIGYVRASSSQFDQNLLNNTITNLFSWENINTNTGIRIDEQSNDNDNYTAANKLQAGYLNFILPYRNRFTLVAGVRVEQNIQQLGSRLDGEDININNDITRVLPSANLSYNISDRSLFRLAYGKTLNRPEFRELAPFSFYDFDTNFTLTGFPGLKTASIDNFDLKYEFYPSSSELISLSGFYKKFENPIEARFKPGSGSGGAKTFDFRNEASAENFGAELELRKSLAGMTNSKLLNDLTVLINASYIYSRVEITDPNLPDRPLQGQAPYIINTALFYTNAKTKLQVNLLYNVIGKRIAYVGYLGYPDIYEMPRNVLDLVVTKSFSNKLSLRANFNDLLNQQTQMLQNGNGDKKFDRVNDQIISSFKNGRLFGLTLTYKLF